LFTAGPSGASGADELPNLWGELQRGEWPSGFWEGPITAPWNHSFVALDSERLLDWNQGTGAFRVWRLMKPEVGEIRLDGPSAVAPGPGPGAFRREHRIVRLDKARLLEWMPRPCPRPRGAEEARCTGADYRIWRYRVDDSSPLSLSFAAEP